MATDDKKKKHNTKKKSKRAKKEKIPISLPEIETVKDKKVPEQTKTTTDTKERRQSKKNEVKRKLKSTTGKQGEASSVQASQNHSTYNSFETTETKKTGKKTASKTHKKSTSKTSTKSRKKPTTTTSTSQEMSEINQDPDASSHSTTQIKKTSRKKSNKRRTSNPQANQEDQINTSIESQAVTPPNLSTTSSPQSPGAVGALSESGHSPTRRGYSLHSRGSDNTLIPIKVESRSFLPKRIARLFFAPVAPPLPIGKMLLPNEQHVDARLILYFSELQIFFGMIAVIISILVGIIGNSFISFFLIAMGGLVLILTSSESEEIHLTTSRLLIRRVNALDRLFRVPRDSQYILDAIVSFELGRSPINELLLAFGILPWVLLFNPNFSRPIIIPLLLVYSIPVIIISLRLTRRVLVFNMSGGHSVIIGKTKGIPIHWVDSFIEILLDKTIVSQLILHSQHPDSRHQD